MDNLKNNSIDTSEKQLNDLFREVLDGLRDDLVEASMNVDEYYKAVSVQGGKDLYGTLYNDALRVKGAARDRQLKFLNTFKERVTKKEAIQIARELKAQEGANAAGKQEYDHSKMNDYLEELNKAGKLAEVELDFGETDDNDE